MAINLGDVKNKGLKVKKIDEEEIISSSNNISKDSQIVNNTVKTDINQNTENIKKQSAVNDYNNQKKHLKEKLSSLDKKYQKEFERSEKDKGALYYWILGGNTIAESQFKKNNKTYKDYQNTKKELNALNLQEQVEESNKKETTALERAVLPFVTGAIKGAEGLRTAADKLSGQTDVETSPNYNDIRYEKLKKETKNPIEGIYQDLTYTTGNMAPSLAVGNKIGALATTGLSSFGNAYNQVKQEGKSEKEATLYGIANGSLEAGLQKVLGGISSVYGNSVVGSKIKNVTNKLISNKVLSDFIADAGSEFTEEYLQEILDPVVRNITMNEKNEFKPFTEDALYSGLLGALNSGLMNGTNFAINRHQNRITQNMQNDDSFNSNGTINTKNQSLESQTSNVENNLFKTLSAPANESLLSPVQNNMIINNRPNNISTQPIKVNLKQSAQTYNIDTNSETINSIDKTLTQRGIKAKFDANMFTNNNENAFWKLNEDGSREVVFNPKAKTNDLLENVAVHELYHDIASSKDGEKLKAELLEFAKTKEGYQEARNSLEKTYSSKYDSKSEEFTKLVDEEAVASILGKKLGNQEFVNALTLEKPSVSKNIYNWVVDKLNKLNKMAGYKSEKLFWSDVKNKFENAYRETPLNNEVNSEKFSIKIDSNGNQFVNVDTDQHLFDGKNLNEQTKIAKKYILDKFRKSGLTVNDSSVAVTSKTANEYTHPRNQLPLGTKSAKMRSSTELDNLLKISKYQYSKPDDGRHPFAKDGWDYYETIFNVDGKFFKGLVNIGKSGNKKTLYDITQIKRISQNRSTSANAFTTSLANSINKNIPQSNNNVKSDISTKYSMQKNENQSKNNKWDQYVNDNFTSDGTGATLSQLKTNKVLNPLEIANLKPEDANTTPKLKNIRVEKGTGNSSFYNNIVEKTGMLSKDNRARLAGEDDIRFYKKVTNEESLNEAYKRLQEGGESETLRWIKNDSKNIDSVDVAEGWILLKQYQDAGDYNSMIEVSKKMREMGTKSGQAVQAYNIMSRLTPEGMVNYAQSELTDAYNHMVKNKTKKWIDANQNKFQLTPEETKFIVDTMQEVSKMEDGYNKKVKLAQIQKAITDKLPPAKGANIKSWMRISMLFNPKTQIRNILGNAVVAPVNIVSDSISSLVDKQIAKKTGLRTTGNFNIKEFSKGFKKGLYESYNDFKLDINTRDMEGNRFEIGDGKSFNDNSIVGHKLNQIDHLLNFALDAGDRPFYEGTFMNSINNQLVLNNTDTVTQDMIDIATQEALQRTWQDNNEYTKFVLNTRRGLNKLNVNSYGIGDVLVPFAKTPANLTKALIDYSPVGMVNVLTEGKNLYNSISNNQYTSKMQHKFVQDLGKATAGSMLYILGYALAKSKITTGENDDDRDVSDFMKNTLGIQPYSIKIGNQTFTYDWAQPVAGPLAIMANLEKQNVNNEDSKLYEKILSTVDTGVNLILQQSFMDSIQSVLTDNDGVTTGLINQILDLPARAIPTFVKQINDMVDGTQRSTYEKNQLVKTAKNKIETKIPGLSTKLAPVRDTLGREVKKYGRDNNPFNVFLNPANVNKGKASASAKEIYKVYEATGDKTIMPRKPTSNLGLDSKQSSEFLAISGQCIDKNIEKLKTNKYYLTLDADYKAEVIKGIVDYSYNKAKSKVTNTEMSNLYKKANEYVNNGGALYDYYVQKVYKKSKEK